MRGANGIANGGMEATTDKAIIIKYYHWVVVVGNPMSE